MKIESGLATKRMFRTVEFKIYINISLAKRFVRIVSILAISSLLAGASYLVIAHEYHLPDAAWARRFERAKAQEQHFRFPKY